MVMQGRRRTKSSWLALPMLALVGVVAVVMLAPGKIPHPRPQLPSPPLPTLLRPTGRQYTVKFTVTVFGHVKRVLRVHWEVGERNDDPRSVGDWHHDDVAGPGTLLRLSVNQVETSNRNPRLLPIECAIEIGGKRANFSPMGLDEPSCDLLAVTPL
jgi:hypothetical protein